MSAQEVSVEDVINQLTTVVLALAHSQAAIAPEHTLARLGAAVLACQQQGYGDQYALQIFEKAFPGQSLPIVVSSEELAKMQK
ncbi:hypothetical protein [Pseudomonas taiwanensis]|uniref:hypothetical protein n=1 Tax=Pseudomonas taiwanensis TaxID=470150 RepID=UPI000404D86A|nr:hypothetical protein [Pseudomonas taiwanensis]